MRFNTDASTQLTKNQSSKNQSSKNQFVKTKSTKTKSTKTKPAKTKFVETKFVEKLVETHWILVGTIALLWVPSLAAIATAKSSDGIVPRSARIQFATGKVRVQRENYSNTIPARQGTELNRGDLIFPDQGVRVTVLCPTGSQSSIATPSGLETVCPVWRKDIVRGQLNPDIPGELDQSTPYLQIPHRQLMLSTTPTLRWSAVSGATLYTVEVSSLTGKKWKTQTPNAQIVYAGEPLEPGVAYQAKITAATPAASAEQRADTPRSLSTLNRSEVSGKPISPTSTTLELRVLRPAEVATIQTTIAQLRGDTPNNNEVAALMVSTYYQDYVLPDSAIAAYGLTQDTADTYRLSTEAIALLEAQLQRRKTSAIMYRTLGNLYWQTGLIDRAEDAYLKAIYQVQSPEDLEEWTLAYYGLAQVYIALRRSQQAAQWLTQARMGFIFLGNLDKAKELQPLIEKLTKTTANSSN
jgi:Tetratricopeptide repeat